MDIEIIEQVKSFFIFFISGFIIGLIFDIFRILRKSFKTSDIFTYIEDVIFGILTGLFLIFTIFIYGNGTIRWYKIISLTIGILIYLWLLSKYFIKVNVLFIESFKKIIILIIKILAKPTKYILKIINKPVTMIIFNINKFNNISKKKFKKIHIKKKDFNI